MLRNPSTSLLITKTPQRFTGSYLVAVGASMWALDALFRSELIGRYSVTFIVFISQMICLAAVLPILWVFRQELRGLSKKDWAVFSFISIASNVLAMVAFTYAFSSTSNYSIPILIQKVQPFFAIFSAAVILKERLPKNYVPLAVVAIAGSLMVAFGNTTELSFHSRDVTAAGFALIAAILWGLGTTAGRYVSVRHSFWLVTAVRYAIGAILMLAAFPLWIGELGSASSQLAVDLPRFLGLALIPGLLALFIYYRGMRVTKASVACWLELFYPVTAVTVNWIFLGSRLNAIQICGCLILVAAVIVMNLADLKKTKK
ncbi:MAG: DMT family transporter [Bdellovibrionaceae bacterium]|nr:DMT family transporter [Pseudobdellovibrionaceae bacterium]